MKRRDFLKLAGVAPIAPSVLAVKEKPQLTVADVRKLANTMEDSVDVEHIFILVNENWYEMWRANETYFFYRKPIR